MSDGPEQPRGKARASGRTRSQVLWPLAFVGLTLGLILAIVIGFVIIRLTAIPRDLVSGGRELAIEAMESVERIAQAFSTGTVQTSFVSYATELSGGAYLQFATIGQTEVFERTDSASFLWGRLKLPDVVVEARVPVRYTYYLDLEDEWLLTLEGTTVDVLAPLIQPNQPAVDTSAIDYRVQSDSVLRDEDAVLEQLRLGITEELAIRAEDNISLVRELGRRTTADFVRTFLLSQFGEEVERYRIEVRFRDELDGHIAEPGAERELGSPVRIETEGSER